MKNNSSMGAATPTTVNSVALNRASGFKQTMSAMESSTKSKYSATEMNNDWIKLPGSGTGGNVKGYGE